MSALPVEVDNGDAKYMSNTARPIYYDKFRTAVMRGEIPVCKEIAQEMNRIDALVANPNVWYDPRPTEGFIRYCEAELTLTDGRPLHLLDTFKLWAESIFAWYYYVTKPVWVPNDNPDSPIQGSYVNKTVKKRLINKQYLIVARGAAKSMYASCLQSYFLNMDTSTTHQIATAPTMKQAEEVMSPIRTSITRSRGPLFQFLTHGSINNTTGNRNLRQKLVSTKRGIENFLTNSFIEIRPMSVNKLQGLRTKVNTVDEWLSGDIRENVIEALEQGASRLPDWLIVAISSEGTVRNGAGDTIKMELAGILKDNWTPHVSIWHYKLDSLEEVSNPAMWPKAQPNIGKTVDWEVYHQAVERAERAPAHRNDILAKRFGIPMAGTTFFFEYSETEPFPPRPRAFMGMPCALGADLSQGDDFCAFTFLFPMGRTGKFGVKTRSYITDQTLMRLQPSARQKYDEFIDEGTLMIMPGVTLDMAAVYQDLDTHITTMGYDVRCLGYDPYNSKEFLELYVQDYGPNYIEKVIQGAKTESVPLGEIKKLAEGRLLIFDELLMQYCMGNAVVEEDTNFNRKLSKQRYEEKIDNVSALMDGYIAWKANKEMFE